MTCFSAKGLKGKVVIIGSCVDGLLPSFCEDDDLDEQRRLFYVAITRCEYTENGFEGLLIISSFVDISENEKKTLGLRLITQVFNLRCSLRKLMIPTYQKLSMERNIFNKL